MPSRWHHSSAIKHNIVVLDECFPVYPRFDFDYSIKYYTSTRPDQLPSRVKDATIIVTSDTRITREGILSARKLQLVATNSTGTDSIDTTTLRELGIVLCNVPAQSTESVAEHALALYYGLRRNILEMHRLTMEGKAWNIVGKSQLRLQHTRTLPRTNAEETLVVIGYGALGRRVESLGEALGMQTLIAERKAAPTIRPGRVPFLQCLKLGTVFIITAPLNETTRGMMGELEFAAMHPTSLLINVGRGGIINEDALVSALRQGHIGGAAVDVYEDEPATPPNSPLLDPSIPNLLLSPHIAWYSKRTIKNTLLTQKANLEGFVAGKLINVVIPPKANWLTEGRGQGQLSLR
ncbi:hypothetical protein NLG97_g2851 [Lecanicillium saksenae]|uniref:Uncharacterized protein n=1 Tax=Lecanicillium saksenae TaxID=468837 RepID=A0ACC1R0E1_9HYPO|nr:hypothetical protein NLG97_g2851 [Lecanicillium saksenae]